MNVFDLSDPSLQPAKRNYRRYIPIPQGDAEISLDTIIWFGRYQGHTVESVINNDYIYALWACENVARWKLDKAAMQHLMDAQDAAEFADPEWNGNEYDDLHPGHPDNFGHK